MRAIYFFSKGEKHEKWVLHTQQSIPKSHTFKTYLGFVEIPNIDAEQHNKADIAKRYGPYLLDIDANKEKGKSFDEAIADTCKLVDKLLALGVKKEHFQVFFSGKKGFHVLIPAEVLGAEDGDPYMALIHKKLDAELFPIEDFPNLDRSIRSMGMGRMIRIPNSKRSDNKKYKIQVTLEELKSLKEEDFLKLASEPRKCWGSASDLQKNKVLSELFDKSKEEVHLEQKNKQLNPSLEGIPLEEVPPCLEKILATTTKLQDDVSFNQLCFSCLVPTFKKMGFGSPQEALALEKVSHFLDNFEESSSYTTAIQRTDHFIQCWSHDENTPREFSCGAMVLASGNDASMCFDCPLYSQKILEELKETYGELVTFEELVEIQKETETHKRSSNKFIDNMNREYTLSLQGGKSVVIQDMGDDGIRFLTANALYDYFKNVKISSVTPSGKPTSIGGGNFWIEHKDRATASRIVFKQPSECREDEYNIWKGFTKKSDDRSLKDAHKGCKLYLKHVKEIICNGDEDSYDYVMTWLAHLIQRPFEKPGTCLVLKSDEGTGKGTFVKPLMDIIGNRHSISIAHKSHFFSNFNSTLESKILVFLDEAVRASNRSEEGSLKSYITEPSISIERKGFEPYSIPSYMRVIMASNNDWVVPAGKNARRFVVLEVSEDKMQDSGGYFKELYHELENGGTECLLKVLENWEIKRDIRKVIRTNALLEQIEYSYDDVDKFLSEIIFAEQLPQDVVDSGVAINEENRARSFVDMIPGENTWAEYIQMPILFSSYLEWRKLMQISGRPKTKQVFSKKILKLLGLTGSDRIVRKRSGKMLDYYKIGSLENLTEKFKKTIKI